MCLPYVCTGSKKLAPIAKGNSVSEPEVCTRKMHSRKWTRVACADVGYARAVAPFIHSNCSANQYIALRNRVLAEVPRPTAVGLSELRETLKLLKPLLHKTVPLTPVEFANTYVGRRRARYLFGAEQYTREGIKKSDARVSMFVKDERIPLNPLKPKPDPRAIQFRGAKYCVALGRHLKPLEHQIYDLKGDGVFLPPTRLIGKGLSQGQRAMLLKRKWNSIADPVCVSLDASRFDMHCDEHLLEIEHEFYKCCNSDPEFATLLRYQLLNSGRTREGMKYKCRGKRMSGDMNTALGNCVNMILMVATFCRLLGIKFELIDDGDDCLLIISRSDLRVVLDNVHAMFLEYGHEIKVENVAFDFESIVWCQCSPIQLADNTWTLVRNPWKCLMNALGGPKWASMPTWLRRKMCYTIGSAELALSLGVPILQDFALALMRNSGTEQLVGDGHEDFLTFRLLGALKSMKEKHLLKYEPKPITDLARISFFKAFALTTAQQLDIEENLRTWVFDLEGDVSVGIDIDVDAWVRPSGIFGPDHYRL